MCVILPIKKTTISPLLTSFVSISFLLNNPFLTLKSCPLLPLTSFLLGFNS